MAKSYLVFREQPKHRLAVTRKWSVLNTGGEFLGEVVWKASWRRYVFQVSVPTVVVGVPIFDSSCLQEITAFLDARMTERKNATRRD